MATSTRKKSNIKVVEVPQVDSYGHRQPQNLDMENAVVGAVMIEQDAYGMVSEILKPESFYDHRNQLIYKAVQNLSLQQKPVDMLSVTDYLEQQGELEEAGGPANIVALANGVTSSAHIVYHAKVVQLSLIHI